MTVFSCSGFPGLDNILAMARERECPVRGYIGNVVVVLDIWIPRRY